MRKTLAARALLVTLTAAPFHVPAQTPATPILPLDKIRNQADLDRTLRALDAAVFDAYNTCDLPTFESFFTDDVEFYHDQGGITLGKTALSKSIKDNICGKVTRSLLPGTFEAHPMKGIGALEIGTHLFHHPTDPSNPDGQGRFVHLWVYKGGAWKISRVYSFDHHEAAHHEADK